MYPNQNNANNGMMAAGAEDPVQQNNLNYNGMPSQQQQQSNSGSGKSSRKKPFVKIVEQPASKALRFRYECEGRSAGSIPGANSTSENKTYPTIEIVGYKGRAVVVVSCVTKDLPYRPHPHNLVGKEGCKKGVCTVEISSETMRAVFSNLGIQCVKKKDIENALKAREEIRVDPFKTGFSHRYQPSSIDLNAVRLCFQVFLESDQKGRFTTPLQPVVSDPIFDKKAMSDLAICRLCNCSSTVLGNTQNILLCEKVAKEDIAVRFYEEKDGLVVWEAFGDFQHTDVHKQTAIAFKTPRYHSLDITEPAKVFLQLRRPSDGVTSEALPFEYIPLDSDPVHLRRKRQKTGGDPMHLLMQTQQQNDFKAGRHKNMSNWNPPNIPAIKTEPRDTSPQPFGNYRTHPELTPSPQPLSPLDYHSTPSPVPAVLGNGYQLSPNHPFIEGAGAMGGGSNNNTAVAMDMHDYGPFGVQQQHQQHQQPQQHSQQRPNPQHQQQQQPETLHQMLPQQTWGRKNNFNNCNYNERYGKGGAENEQMNSLLMHQIMAGNNNNNNNTIGEHPTTNHQWNVGPNNVMQQQQMMPQHQPHHGQQPHQQQAHTQFQQHQSFPQQTANVANDNLNTNENEQGHTLSNLLNFDSDQLVHMNSEDQQMLRLNTEDLQISNLSIST